MSFEKPPTPPSPEDEVRRETERLDALREKRLRAVHQDCIEGRKDLSAEQKAAVLNAMLEHPEYEWGEVDGQDVKVLAVHMKEDGHLEFDFEMYGMEWGSPRRIKV